MKISEREKRLIITALIITFILLTVKYLALPYVKGYLAIQSALTAEEQQLKLGQLTIRDKGKYELLLQKRKEELSYYRSHFYCDKAERVRVEMINLLDNLAREHDLQIRNKELDSISTEGSYYSAIKYRIGLEGNLAGLASYLEDINNTEKYIQVTELEIKGGENQEQLSIMIGIEVITIEGDQHEGI